MATLIKAYPFLLNGNIVIKEVKRGQLNFFFVISIVGVLYYSNINKMPIFNLNFQLIPVPCFLLLISDISMRCFC